MGHALSLRNYHDIASLASGAASDMFAWRGGDHSRTVDVSREI